MFALFLNLPRVKRVSICGCHDFFEVGPLRLVDLRVWSEFQRNPTSERLISDAVFCTRRRNIVERVSFSPMNSYGFLRRPNKFKILELLACIFEIQKICASRARRCFHKRTIDEQLRWGHLEKQDGKRKEY